MATMGNIDIHGIIGTLRRGHLIINRHVPDQSTLCNNIGLEWHIFLCNFTGWWVLHWAFIYHCLNPFGCSCCSDNKHNTDTFYLSGICFNMRNQIIQIDRIAAKVLNLTISAKQSTMKCGINVPHGQYTIVSWTQQCHDKHLYTCIM